MCVCVYKYPWSKTKNNRQCFFFFKWNDEILSVFGCCYCCWGRPIKTGDNVSDYSKKHISWLCMYPCVCVSVGETNEWKSERERERKRERCKQNYSPGPWVFGCRWAIGSCLLLILLGWTGILLRCTPAFGDSWSFVQWHRIVFWMAMVTRIWWRPYLIKNIFFFFFFFGIKRKESQIDVRHESLCGTE